MTIHYKLSAKARRKMREKLRRDDERRKKLSAPITRDKIVSFCRHLLAVSFGSGEECWIYMPLHRKKKLPQDTAFKTNAYAQVSHNGEMVGAHKFAYCVAQGIPLPDLEGMDVHHDLSRCIGYRCCNPDHLEAVPSRPHRGTRGAANTLNPRHVKLVNEVLTVTPSERRPEEYRRVTGAGSRQRLLGGIPFCIGLAQMEGIEE